MADDKRKKKPQDASRMHMQEDNEIQYGCQTCGRTTQQLLSAVQHVGVTVDTVAAELKRRGGMSDD